MEGPPVEIDYNVPLDEVVGSVPEEYQTFLQKWMEHQEAPPKAYPDENGKDVQVSDEDYELLATSDQQYVEDVARVTAALLSGEDFVETQRQQFEEIDEDGAGEITVEQMDALVDQSLEEQGGGDMEPDAKAQMKHEMFASMDDNGDEKITLDEWTWGNALTIGLASVEPPPYCVAITEDGNAVVAEWPIEEEGMSGPTSGSEAKAQALAANSGPPPASEGKGSSQKVAKQTRATKVKSGSGHCGCIVA